MKKKKKKQELVEQNYILAENVSFIHIDDIFYSNKIVCVCSVTQLCLTLSVTPWTAAHQAPLSMAFSRQEYWNCLQFPIPGDLPNPGIKPTPPALAGVFFTTMPPGKLQ